ncbi:MAG: hypothetical protein IJC02_13845 [Lachnospiraceae bacterium]|nr:hypothetical protein [Lachnospiraceae bacterium]
MKLIILDKMAREHEKFYDVVIPIVDKDFDKALIILPYIKAYLPVKRMVLIGSEKVKAKMSASEQGFIDFIDENQLINIERIREIIGNRTNNDEQAIKRTGWYLQQFIKMYYATICEDEYYIVWDVDTLPLHKIEFLVDRHPVFHMKTEFCESYFITISKILHDVDKCVDKSFIAEHMFVKCSLMNDMIHEIEKNENLKGKVFYEKILYAIEEKDIKNSGFSEFETFGSFCMKRYPTLYYLQTWKSMRDGAKYFNIGNFGKSELEWVRRDYDAISFEKYSKEVVGKSFFHKKVVHKIIGVDAARLIFNVINKIFICLNR